MTGQRKTPSIDEYFATLDDPREALDFLLVGLMDEAKFLGETLPAGGDRMTHMAMARAQWLRAFRASWSVVRA